MESFRSFFEEEINENLDKDIKEFGKFLKDDSNLIDPKKVPELDSDANELKLYIDNDYQLYSSRFQPIVKNLSKKVDKDEFNGAGAVRIFLGLAKDGAKKYKKEFDDSDYNFDKNCLLNVALNYALEFQEENIE